MQGGARVPSAVRYADKGPRTLTSEALRHSLAFLGPLRGVCVLVIVVMVVLVRVVVLVLATAGAGLGV